MSRTTRHRRPRFPVPPPSPELAERLAALAGLLDDTAELDGWGVPPLLVRCRPVEGPDAFELGLRPIDDGESVLSYLCGFRAPADWHVIGVVSEGRARDLDVPARGGRARIVHLVHRSGVHASVVRRQGDATALVPDGPAVGRVDDHCRRALGIAAPPPATGVLTYLVQLWLDRLLDRVPATWAAAAALHPASQVIATDPTVAAQCSSSTDLVAYAPEIGGAISWEGLRRHDAEGAPGALLAPRHAAWLDAGSYSREVLGALPPLEDLTAAVLDALPASVSERVGAALTAWGFVPGGNT